MKKVIYYGVTVFILLVIIVNIFSLLNLSLFGFRIFKVASGSMVPYLNVGDIIVIKKSDVYKTEDIITYKEGDKSFVTHRIVSIDEDGVTTKGDANNTNDKPVKDDEILGKVVCRFRYLPMVLSKPLTWCLFFVVGSIFVFALPKKEDN